MSNLEPVETEKSQEDRYLKRDLLLFAVLMGSMVMAVVVLGVLDAQSDIMTRFGDVLLSWLGISFS